MTSKIIFFPIGNGDSTLISLENGANVLIDYANMKCEDDASDHRCDLPVELNKRVKEDFAVVVFTHADKDHINRFSEYFYLQHAAKYQDFGRKKITELWVPAAIILETAMDNPEAKILRAEARYRLKNKKGIKVFSNPEKLEGWLNNEGMSLEEVRHLIVNAGETVPGWTLCSEGIEFFVHSPFSYWLTDEHEIDKNECCIVMQATFNNAYQTKLLLGGDATSELLHEIVSISEHYDRSNRLLWDVIHIPHHCSYLSLGPEKGEEITEPVGPVKKLYEEYGQEKGILISPSKIISTSYDDDQPPHRQAFNYYNSVKELKNGDFKVTMEFPSKNDPKPLEIKIDGEGATIVKTVVSAGFASQRTPPRAG